MLTTRKNSTWKNLESLHFTCKVISDFLPPAIEIYFFDGKSTKIRLLPGLLLSQRNRSDLLQRLETLNSIVGHPALSACAHKVLFPAYVILLRPWPLILKFNAFTSPIMHCWCKLKLNNFHGNILVKQDEHSGPSNLLTLCSPFLAVHSTVYNKSTTQIYPIIQYIKKAFVGP